MDLQLEIVTPEKQAFSGRADEVTVPGAAGEFGVLPMHDNFLALVKAGVAKISRADGVKRYVVGPGFAEVTTAPVGGGGHGYDTKVTLLTEVCEPAESVDKEKARRDLEEATRLLAEADGGSEREKIAQQRMDLAQARLDV
jgi:F-type H+-transporting ATPase subunit epsilon